MNHFRFIPPPDDDEWEIAAYFREKIEAQIYAAMGLPASLLTPVGSSNYTSLTTTSNEGTPLTLEVLEKALKALPTYKPVKAVVNIDDLLWLLREFRAKGFETHRGKSAAGERGAFWHIQSRGGIELGTIYVDVQRLIPRGQVMNLTK